MRTSSPRRVRYRAEWVEELPDGAALAVGDPVVCPHDTMFVREIGTYHPMRGAEDRGGNELPVSVAPYWVAPGSRWRVVLGHRGRTTWRTNGTEVYEGDSVELDELLTSPQAVLEALAAYADKHRGWHGDNRGLHMSVVVSCAEPREEGPGRRVVGIHHSDGVAAVDGLGRAIAKLERLCANAEQEPGQPWSDGSRLVRYVTEWVEDPATERAFVEGDRIDVPPRPLVVRRFTQASEWDRRSAWVSVEADAGFAVEGHALRGADVVAVVGEGLIAPQAEWHVDASARTAGFRSGSRHQGLDLTFDSLDEALNAVAEWAESVSNWATASGLAGGVRGGVQLSVVEPGREKRRTVAGCGMGSEVGIDAFLAVLHVFCDAAEARYAGGLPAAELSYGDAGERSVAFHVAPTW